MTITITPRAVDKIIDTARKESVNLSETMLRIAVVPGGCSGLTYDLGWDTTLQDGDDVQELEGIRFVLDRRSSVYIEGSELDFTDGIDGRGFFFSNPQAVRNCACGESFGV